MKKHHTIQLFIVFIVLWGIYSYKEGLEQNQTYIENTTNFSQLVSYYDNEEYAKVIQHGPSLISEQHQSHEILYITAMSNYEKNNYESAIHYFEQAFEVYPYYVENDEALIYYGLSFYQLSDYEKAAIVYKQLNTIHITAHHFKGFQELQSLLTSKGLIQ